MRLVDADTVVTIQVYDDMTEQTDMKKMTIAEAIDEWSDEGCPPTVDAEPVRHGHWITWFENKDVRQAKCSECGMMFTLGKGRDIHYCGNCGEKMDEVEHEQ